MSSTGVWNVIINNSPTSIIFVGGSRGSGKTTCSCALAALITDERRSVLLVSVKSHYSVSDVFKQQFSETPTYVNGYINLSVIELEPTPPSDQFLLDEIFEAETVARKINKNLANYMFQTFHNYGDDEKFAKILKMLGNQKYDFIVFDTAASVDTFGLWPLELDTGESDISMKRSQMTESRHQNDPKFKNTLYEHFNPKACSEILISKLEQMMHIHPQIKETDKTVFFLVDTIHPLHLLGNRILISSLAEISIRTKIVANKLKTRNIPYCSGNGFYISDIDNAIFFFHNEYQLIRLPLWREELKGDTEINGFSKTLFKVCPVTLYKGMQLPVIKV